MEEMKLQQRDFSKIKLSSCHYQERNTSHCVQRLGGLGTVFMVLVAQLVKNPPAMQETLVQFLGQEDSLQEGMATHSSILAWRSPMNREAWQATAHGVTKNQT